MPNQNHTTMGRRGLFKTSAAVLGGALLGKRAKAEQASAIRNVNTNSSPSTLKITDLVIPWQYNDLLKHITDESPTPILTGEDIYLKENFIRLCENHAVSKIHPDISTSGGILETHKIGNAAMEYGVPMAMHYAGLPIGAMASVHCAAATENFLACENHALDIPWWQDLVEGIEKPIINKGFISVPGKPGLGITLNEDAVRQHLVPGTGYFEPTPQWDNEHSLDRLWSMTPRAAPIMG
jgi:hypothetical protein